MGMLNQEDNGQKPLFRKWCVEARKAGNKHLSLPIEKIKLSSSEEWIIIEATEAVALLSADSKSGREFWKNLESFNGQGISLNIHFSKGKLGFDVDFDEKRVCYYIWNDGVLYLSPKKTLATDSQNSLSGLTWEASQQKLETLSSKPSSKGSKTTSKQSIEIVLPIDTTNGEG